MFFLSISFAVTFVCSYFSIPPILAVYSHHSSLLPCTVVTYLALPFFTSDNSMSSSSSHTYIGQGEKKDLGECQYGGRSIRGPLSIRGPINFCQSNTNSAAKRTQSRERTHFGDVRELSYDLLDRFPTELESFLDHNLDTNNQDSKCT